MRPPPSLGGRTGASDDLDQGAQPGGQTRGRAGGALQADGHRPDGGALLQDGDEGSLLTAQDPEGLLQRSDYVHYTAAHQISAIGALDKARVAG